MSLTNLPLIYLEPSVWIAYLREEMSHNRFDIAEHYINEINEGRAIGVVSSLTMLEVIDVIRKRVTESHSCMRVDRVSEEKSIRAEVNQMTRDFVDMITGLAKQNKVILDDPDISLPDYMKNINQCRDKIEGILQISIDYKCRKCGQKCNPRYNAKMIGHYDFQHAMNAALLNAMKFVTFDEAVPKLKSIPIFRHIDFNLDSR